jgi:hypothetical protein
MFQIYLQNNKSYSQPIGAKCPIGWQMPKVIQNVNLHEKLDRLQWEHLLMKMLISN